VEAGPSKQSVVLLNNSDPMMMAQTNTAVTTLTAAKKSNLRLDACVRVVSFGIPISSLSKM